MQIDYDLHTPSLADAVENLWLISAAKIRQLRARYDPRDGSPVFTVNGRYTSRGWTEWTQGFQFGSEILQYEATGDEEALASGRTNTVRLMPRHVTHFGVHDHGFNTISTFGNLRRLAAEGRMPCETWEQRYYEQAIMASAAVQARRWTRTSTGSGFIYSFNGPHSLFADTLRTLRVLALGHHLGHVVLGEGDQPISLLERLLHHAHTTAQYAVYYGEGRDRYDERGRTAHESVFNTNDGSYRCPATQQGYSPFSTWTRGLAWVMCGFAEILEYLWTLPEEALRRQGGRDVVEGPMMKAAFATCDFYLRHTAADGVPYWDTGAPGLARLDGWRERPADPFNDHEPVDSSAAAIAAQGLLRFGRYLQNRGDDQGRTYWYAGLAVARTLMGEPYLNLGSEHEGLLLHSVYHHPNGWDHIPEGRATPSGESSMWGDYHLRELALYLKRVIEGDGYLTFFAPEG